MKNMNLISMGFVGFLLTLSIGCTHLTTVSMTPIPANRSRKVSAEGYRFMFFLFNFDNDYVNTITSDLAQKCPNGVVKGILTKHESITYFPIIAHASKVTSEGYCIAEKGN